jgi:hypothetical protein
LVSGVLEQAAGPTISDQISDFHYILVLDQNGAALYPDNTLLNFLITGHF